MDSTSQAAFVGLLRKHNGKAEIVAIEVRNQEGEIIVPYKLPGGKSRIYSGILEDPRATAKREFFEETGKGIRIPFKALVEVDKKETTEFYGGIHTKWFFLATDFCGEIIKGGNPDEKTTAFWMPVNELRMKVIGSHEVALERVISRTLEIDPTYAPFV